MVFLLLILKLSIYRTPYSSFCLRKLRTILHLLNFTMTLSETIHNVLETGEKASKNAIPGMYEEIISLTITP